MTIGANQGGQLNIAIFEVGMIQRILGVEVVLTTGIHPLLVSPRTWTYVDQSRSTAMETVKGSHEVHAGRALRRGMFEGTFGVENRGLLLYLGVGEVRFKRFYKEVVRMSEAMTKDEVQANTDILNGTPLISLLLMPYNEDTTRFYINFYDFWNDISFQGLIRSFQWTRSFTKGGAQGMIHYRMQVDEVGPLISSAAGAVLSALLAIFTTWDSLNNVLESYTIGNILDSFAAAGAIVVSEFADSMDAVQAQLDSVQNLCGGSGSSSLSPPGDGLAAFFDSVDRASESGQEVLDSLGAGLDTFDAPNGEPATPTATVTAITTTDGESAEINTYQTIQDLTAVLDGLAFQKIAGKFLGMSTAEYQSYITSSAYSGVMSPEIGGSTLHVVLDTDTAETIEQTYGIDWMRILSLNNLIPDEALLEGTELQIPSVRPRGPQGIGGLPTFGSHVGQAAWGEDLPMEIIAAADGDLETVSGPDLLEQGVQILIEEHGETILDELDKVPEAARQLFIRDKISGMLLQDERLVGIQDLTVVIEDTGIDVAVSVTAINGGRISVGGTG